MKKSRKFGQGWALNKNDYQSKIDAEIEHYKDVGNVHDLPAIFHYWSHNNLRPLLLEAGFQDIDHFFADNLYSAAADAPAPFRYVSIGSGNCDLEIRVAKILKDKGLEDFTIECLEINPHMLGRGKELAEAENVESHILFKEADFNSWVPSELYAGVMANHSLHHVTNLEGLFGAVKASLRWSGKFVVSDMIGRNGHQRWPEALEEVQEFWHELPNSYKYNQQIKRYEPQYDNWDCSSEGFEGIRAQDILPLLAERFDFELFIGFLNVASVFIDRGFGHNFDADAEWDRTFIDKVHAVDEDGFQSGKLKPTQMFAVLTPGRAVSRHYSRGISPQKAIRWP
jgi:SAM-dependent methyltransferase